MPMPERRLGDGTSGGGAGGGAPPELIREKNIHVGGGDHSSLHWRMSKEGFLISGGGGWLLRAVDESVRVKFADRELFRAGEGHWGWEYSSRGQGIDELFSDLPQSPIVLFALFSVWCLRAPWPSTFVRTVYLRTRWYTMCFSYA